MAKYVVIERGYEYNDETYDAPDDDNCGIPKLVFTNLKKAADYCWKKNFAEFKNFNSNHPPDYYSPYCNRHLDDGQIEILKQAGFVWKINKWNELVMKYPDTMTDEQVQALMECYSELRFFDVVEVEEG